ncbi:MAG: FAD-dependent oxidoreductase [Planctomycetota bacterium]|nr:MAG: FAD-dependent oxidoreductase [Planctomycetota bacterium]
MIAPTKKETEKVGAVLVIGGGIAGIQASLDLAESGQKVYLLEKSPAIGGNMARLDKTFPTNDCSMCILSPKIVECGRHLNIETITWADLEDVSGSAGDFKVKVRKHARFVDPEKCTGCGECVEMCPVTVASEFEGGIGQRKAIFRPYPQAYPNTFVIDKGKIAPCRNTCPAGVNVQGFVALLAQGKFDEALELYRARNPFPATCGRICTHPCQEVCNRGRLDEALAVRDLHRFLADREIAAVREGRPPQLSEHLIARRQAEFPLRRGAGRRIAIVGSGPAGLTCGWDLVNMGYKPVVFEELSVTGGMLRVGVPRYRLPIDVLDYEIDAIRRAGVEIRLNTPVGPDLTLNDMLEQGFEAIFIAVGTHKSRELGIEGEDLDGVIHGTRFLHRAKMEQPTDIANRIVVVVGGGNAAIDSARTSLRLGARRVTVLYRRGRDEMPASDQEIEACREEGIEFRFKASPTRILGTAGHVAALECVRMALGEPDETGRRRPTPIKDSKFIIEADIVIPAISQEADISVLADLKAVQVTETGLVPVTGTELKGVRGFTDLLRAASLGERVDLGERVIVIGGGNVAVDVARTVIRLGVRDVHLACLEAPDEMFASPEEVRAAREEGVTVHNRLSPKRIVARDGHAAGVEFRECLSVFDKEGRFSPVVRPGSESIMPADSVVVAIGQTVDWELLKAADGILETRAGFISVDPDTLVTNVKRIFAGGDVVTGPDVAVNAIVAGHKAAASIDRFLNAEDLQEGRNDIKPKLAQKDLAPIPQTHHPHEQRVPMPTLPVDERIKGFDEVERGYTEEQAVQEAKRCLHCSICSECLQCASSCKAEAICHQQQDTIEQIDVGAIVVVPGFEEFLAQLKYDFGYSRYPDVVSSVQFERILSASGPFAGHVQRPSDGKEPKKIAFLQCVGSRDISCRNAYCSSVCCMYAIKEAVIAKEHLKDVDVTVFFMDMRAFGKDFDKYYERAKSEYGVRFTRARVSDVYRANGDGRLTVQYVSEAEPVQQDQFDMVVLSVGLEPSEKARKLADKLGVRLDATGFISTEPSDPLQTSRPGVFVAGTASGPKDIPETVIQASGSAGKASQLLADARGSLTIEREFPPERDVTDEEPRIGVFVCQCGINIGSVVGVSSVAEYAGTLPYVVYTEDNLYTCSQDTQDHIREMISEHNLNRVVVASCSPRTHEPLFQQTLREAGLNAHLFEMANIRDQCSWIHMNQPEEATEKARALVRMAVAKVALVEPLAIAELDITPSALVVGGGLAGMTAALAIAQQGFEVALVERQKQLGGNLNDLRYTFDEPDVRAYLKHLTEPVQKSKNITVHTGAELESIEGFIGNFESTLKTKSKRTKIKHGVIIVATGGSEYKPDEYLYGKDSRIATQLELEDLISKGKLPEELKNVVMIQCVGSREEGHMYCSRVCCSTAVKNALKIKDLSPQTEVYMLYRDVRTYGFNEEYFQAARDKGIIFVRYDIDSKPVVTNGRALKVTVPEPMLQQQLMLRPDLLVLSTRIDASPDADRLAKMFKVPTNEDGFFLEAHVKLRPVEFATEGIFVAGVAHSPKSIPETIAQAEAAAAKACTIISKDKYEAEPTIAAVNEDLCDGCGICVPVCEYNALEVVPRKGGAEDEKIVQLNEAMCKGCGGCVAACPSGAMEQKGFKNEQMLAMIRAALED